LNNIGIVSYHLGNFEESTKYSQKAIDLALGFKGNQILWEAFLELANAYKKQNRYLDALKNYKNSISIIEGARSTIELEELKASYIGTDKRIETYHNLIDLLVSLNKSAPHKGYDVEAFGYLEKAKARAFLDSLEVSEVNISQGIDFRLSNREVQIDSEISKLYKKLLASESTPEQRNEINQKIKDCEDELDKLKMEIRRTSPAYADLKYPQIITLKEVQEQLLDGKTTFFAYSIGKDSSYGFAVSKHSLKIFPVSSRNEIQKRVTDYIKAISDKDNNDFHLGYDLFSELVQPGLDDKIQKLVFSPDDILYWLPFEALLTQKNNNQWLINHHTVAYVPSISSLREIIKRSKSNNKKQGKDLLAFGDPLYGDAELENGSKKNADIFQNFYPSQEFKFFPLKYSGIEVQKIASLFKATKEEVYRKEAASEAELKSLRLDNYKIIHFAVHGLIDDQKPTRSSIVLSLNQDSQEDGFVQMREIYNLRMNSDLVTLSACQTGLGQFIRGEGIEGLSRAFFYAGASSVLMSLWAVNDQASYQLMERFYFHLRASLSIMEALQKAKLEMIHSRVFSHPYYWAGFVITGNAAKIIFPRNLTKWIPVVISLCIGGTLFVGFRNLRKKKIRLAVAKMCYRVSHD
jgi:CHAT domain-containing protein